MSEDLIMQNPNSARKLLRRVYGYQEFRGSQETIIQTLSEGGDALVLMPTGGGKSLCFQIPSMLRSGVGIVISPLIALMRDQVDALVQLGVRAAFLNSTLDYESVRETEKALFDGTLDLLYIAPERLVNERTLALLQRIPIALFAIDEAHCVSQWGHDFRPEYRQLQILPREFPAVPRIALTATADQRTRKEIVEQLELQRAHLFVSSFDRPNIRYAISSGPNARNRLWRFLVSEHPSDAGIVYCLSRKRVEDTAAWFQQQGRLALPYHAGLPSDERDRNQQRFLREEGVIIVATIAFGMGIDKPDVRFVAHLNLPKSVEAYYQETGRAGRDGEPADAWMSYGLQDVITMRQWLDQSEADDQHKRIEYRRMESLLGLCEQSTCRRQTLLACLGETLAEPCGNCDNCLNPPQTEDATIAAQKALSCIYRSGQRFGVTHIIDLLRGNENEKVQRFGHQRLSTFGIGTELTRVQWRALFRQLIAGGFSDVDAEQYGALKLTEKSRSLLRGESSIELCKQPSIDRRSKKKSTAPDTDMASADLPLWEALRELRTTLASEQAVPPYVVFHDRTLRAMVSSRPQTMDEFALISGVGKTKLERYGPEFLQLIRESASPESSE